MSNLKKLNQRMLESMWTPEEALKWAEEYYEEHHRWPTRRWRIETVGMSSRLMVRKMAEATRAAYGGDMLEIIPSRKEYLRSKSKGNDELLKRFRKNAEAASKEGKMVLFDE
jgi:hypothetical protein